MAPRKKDQKQSFEGLEQVTIRLLIERNNAILAGESWFGECDFPVDVSQLSEQQRFELVKYGERLPRFADPIDYPALTRPDMEAVKAVLDWRTSLRKADLDYVEVRREEIENAAQSLIDDYLKTPVEKRRYPETVGVDGFYGPISDTQAYQGHKEALEKALKEDEEERMRRRGEVRNRKWMEEDEER